LFRVKHYSSIPVSENEVNCKRVKRVLNEI